MLETSAANFLKKCFYILMGMRKNYHLVFRIFYSSVTSLCMLNKDKGINPEKSRSEISYCKLSQGQKNRVAIVQTNKKQQQQHTNQRINYRNFTRAAI